MGNLLATAPVRAVHLFPLATKGRWAGGLLLFDDTHSSSTSKHQRRNQASRAFVGLAVGEKLRADG